MRDLETVAHFEPLEKMVKVLCKKTQNDSPLFFRVLVAYYFAKLASMMRTNIETQHRGTIPVNLYALNLASSGQGKGHSTNIMEDEVTHLFKERFLNETYPLISEASLAKLAVKRAAKKGTNDDDELLRVTKEFESLGELAFSFDSATVAAVKQMRHKLLMSDAGSMNLEIDEIGSNLLSNADVLSAFLELYDVGKIKQKLVKNTNENVRGEEIDGRTPTNMMLYGTPFKLFDGGKVEDEVNSFFQTGYARRFLVGTSHKSKVTSQPTPDEIFKSLTDTSSNSVITDLAQQLSMLADSVNFGRTLIVQKDVSLLLIEYQLACEKLASNMGEHEEIKRSELAHRYFKAIKLAGAFAFIEGGHEVTEDNLYSAIKLVEESGKAFQKILNRDRNFVKLAKYIADVNREITHVDLVEDLPFYKGPTNQKQELMQLAIAWGYKNNIIIKKSFNDGIEFLRGESLQETDLDNMRISYSGDWVNNYLGEEVPFSALSKLTQAPDMHWVSHHMVDGYRKEENSITGFDMIVLDVDEGVPMALAEKLLKPYKYHMYTTKRHQTPGYGDRFRIVLPMNYRLHLDAKDFKEFMENVYAWLPFQVDNKTNQRARKWETFPGSFIDNDGELLDILPFIPKTAKNEERQKVISDLAGLTNMERWFINNTGTGNRSNQLLKYALMLVDAGFDYDSVLNNVIALNSKLADSIPDAELLTTVMVTAGKAVHKKGTQ